MVVSRGRCFVSVLAVALCSLVSASSELIFVSAGCPKALSLLARYYQEASVREEVDPVFRWAVLNGNKPRDFYQFAIENLENRVIEIIEEFPPELRENEIQDLSADTGLSPSTIQAIIDFYAIRYYEEPLLAGSKSDFWSRLETLNRSLSLTEPKPGTPQSRYLYYLHSLTQDSVPELSTRLGISESRLRNDLSALRLSIVEEFERGGMLTQAKERFEHGVSIPDIAREFRVGEQALRFILHYEKELNRGREWSSAENHQLKALVAQGYTYQKIADAMNRFFQRGASDPDYRTEGAVAAKAEQLQLSVKRVPRHPPSIELDLPYGLVKRNGHLTDRAKAYVRDHFLEPLEEVASTLGVQPQSLEAFIRRHSLVFRDLPEVERSPGRAPGPPGAAVSSVPAASNPAAGIRPAVLPHSSAALPAAPKERAAAVLGNYQKKREQAKEELPALELASLSAAPVRQMTFEQIDAVLVEIAKLQFGGIDKVSTREMFSKKYVDSAHKLEVSGQTLFRVWAQKRFEKNNRGQTVPDTRGIFLEAKSGKTKSAWLEEFKTFHGYQPTLPTNSRILSTLDQDRKPMEYTFPEIDAVIVEIAKEQFGGIDKIQASRKFFSQKYAASGATSEVAGATLFKAWARKKFEFDNPGKDVPDTTKIFSEADGGKTGARWLEEFKTAHGYVPNIPELPEGTRTLSALALNKEIEAYSFAEIDAVLMEIAKEQFGGIGEISSGATLRQQHYAAPGAKSGVSGHTLLTTWAKKKFEKDNPGKPIPSAAKIFNPSKGGKTGAAWLNEFKVLHGYVARVPEGTLILSSLALDKDLADYSFSEIDAAILEIANTQFGGVDKISTSVLFTAQNYAAAGSTSSVIGSTLLGAWAKRKFEQDNPGKKAPDRRKLLSAEEGGKPIGSWLEEFKVSHGYQPKLPEGTRILSALVLGKSPSDYTFPEIDAVMVEIALVQFGGVENLPISDSFMSQNYAPTGATSAVTGQTILTTWAQRKFERDNSGKGALGSKLIFNVSKGGKTKAAWLEEFRTSHLKRP